KEKNGPFGMGKTIEDVKSISIFEEVVGSEYIKELTKDLNRDDKKQVLKEAKNISEPYQKLIEKFAEIMETPEGKKMFAEVMSKKFGIK
ncbi:hypothetical protein CL634_00075, partial [bacterium]|nr:hypothetical protein [bacterium]